VELSSDLPVLIAVIEDEALASFLLTGRAVAVRTTSPATPPVNAPKMVAAALSTAAAVGAFLEQAARLVIEARSNGYP
jgi:hypothetical protein